MPKKLNNALTFYKFNFTAYNIVWKNGFQIYALLFIVAWKL